MIKCASKKHHTTKKNPEKRVPGGGVFGNERIALCNQGQNRCLFAGRFSMNTRNKSDLLSGSVAGHFGSPHASTISTYNNSENYLSEMVCSRFMQQSLISDYLPQQLASDDNLYREQLTEHAPKRV